MAKPELITYEHSDPKTGVTYLLDVPISRTLDFEALRSNGDWINMVFSSVRIVRKDTGEVLKDRNLAVIGGVRYDTRGRTPIDDLRDS